MNSVAHRSARGGTARAPGPHGALALFIAAAGCTGSLDPASGDTDGAGPRATILAEIDTHHFCDMVGVVAVVLRATPRSCGPAGADCTLPDEVDGTVFTCPAIDATGLLAVELQSPANYRIAAVAEFTTGPDALECFAPMDGVEDFEVGQAQIDASAQIHAAPGHAACADN